MNVEPRDEIDRAIDDVLASIMAGEPRRVSAATVRAAMGAEPRRPPIPVWFAVAAILIAVVGLWTRKPESTGTGRPQVAQSVLSAPPSAAAARTATTAPATTAAVVPADHCAVHPALVRLRRASDIEQLPPLQVDGIERPAPLAAAVESEAIVVTSLSLPPLSLPVLQNDHKQ